MKIVHIGAGTTLAEIKHIAEQREAGHDYFVPGDNTYEQTVRRIMDADEIHVFDITREFELGLVYFFSVEALHHKLHWRIRLFDDADGPCLELFHKMQDDYEADVLRRYPDAIIIGKAIFTPGDDRE